MFLRIRGDLLLWLYFSELLECFRVSVYHFYKGDEVIIQRTMLAFDVTVGK